jgi:hypothetical protein
MSDAFNVNEKVLCYHGPLVYEAKVLKKGSFEENTVPAGSSVGPAYFVHYKGWKQSCVPMICMSLGPMFLTFYAIGGTNGLAWTEC